MPGANLTRIEAEERKSIIAAPIHYTVKLDLTRGAKDFGSETTITFDAKPGESSFLDLIANEVSEITLNGETLDPAEAYVDSRIELKGLKEHNEVTVKAMCQYSNTGEGLHRSVDPSDRRTGTHPMTRVPARATVGSLVAVVMMVGNAYIFAWPWAASCPSRPTCPHPP